MRTVLLRHSTPDGASHLDWMIEPLGGASDDDPDARCLTTFRIEREPDDVVTSVRGFDAARLPDHRAVYLDVFEHELSGGRGRVVRVASGRVDRCDVSPAVVRVTGTLAGARLDLRGVPLGRTTEGGERMWRFEPCGPGAAGE